MKICLLRHGRTELNAQRRYQGRLDVPLSREGEEELRRSELKPETVFTSPLLRARQTARILFPAARQEIVTALAEMDFGDFEGRSADEMAEDTAYRIWVEQGCEGRCPNGESRGEFCSRTCRAFESLVNRAAAEEWEMLVIVAHGGTLGAVMESFCEPARGFFEMLPPLGGGYVLDYDAALWDRERKLRLKETVCYGKGEPPC